MRRSARVLAVVGAAVLLAGCPAWPVPDQNPDRTSYNDAEQAITVANVGQLQPKWTWNEPVSNIGSISTPVVSSGGVHVTKGCALATVDPATGTTSWLRHLVDPQFCGLMWTETSEPYGVTSGDGDRIAIGWGNQVPVSPGSIRWVWEWWNLAVDADTGAEQGSAANVRSLAAVRGAQLAGVGANRDQWQTDYNTLSVGTVDGSSRQFVTALGDGQRGQVTLPPGGELVLHAGSGAMTTTAGPSTQAPAVRAYSTSEARPGCTITPGFPFPSTVDLECPVWVNDLGGLPQGTHVTAPVLGPGGTVAYVVAGTTLYALDTATGATLWTGGGAGGQPALAGGTLYVPTDDGMVVTFPAAGCEAPTCSHVTRFDTHTGGNVSDAVVAGELVYVTVGGTIFTFHKIGCPNHSCAPLSSIATGETSLSAPVVDRGQVYVSAGQSLLAFGLP